MNPETTPPASSDAPPCSAWSISGDGENYGYHQFETREEAIAEGRSLYAGSHFFVGQCERPTSPEEYFEAGDWLETVSCQFEYCGEHAEDWDMSSKEQREELNAEVRKVMSDWLTRHSLRPSFWNIVNPERIEPNDLAEVPR